MNGEKLMSEKESLDLITMMINKANHAYHSTGVSSIMWGAVVALCAVLKWAEIQFGFSFPVDVQWLAVIAIVPQILLSIKEKKERKVRTYDDVYMDYIWLAFGISLVLLIFIVNAVYAVWYPVTTGYSELSGKPIARFSEFIAPLFLMLYGMPTFVTGAACKFRPMFWGGLLCWTCCIITIFTAIRIDLLLTALSAVFAWLVPGIIMEKDYRKAKKELAAAHV